MRIHRKYFFDSVRASIFSGSLTQKQTDGLAFLMDYAELNKVDDRQLAYVLATTFHETAATMQPIEEYGKGSGKKYGQPAGPYNKVYYGRGYVQLTWYENYVKQDKKLKLDGRLVKDPGLALDPEISRQILFRGMADGDFTGQCLKDHITCTNINDDKTDFHNARKIVNALDKASLIAGYATKFAAGLTRTPAQ